MTRLLALIAATFLFSASAFAQTLKPVDQSAKDPKLAELIATLIRACDQKDFKPFEAALSPDAIGSFGGDPGVQGFRDDHGIDRTDTTFYADFKDAVTMGGAFIDNGTYGDPMSTRSGRKISTASPGSLRPAARQCCMRSPRTAPRRWLTSRTSFSR